MVGQPQAQAQTPAPDTDDPFKRFAKLFDPGQAVTTVIERSVESLKGDATRAFEKVSGDPTAANFAAALKAEALQMRPGQKLVGGQWVNETSNDPAVAAAVDAAVQKETHGGPVTRDMLDGIAKDLQDATRTTSSAGPGAGAHGFDVGGGLKGLMDMMKTVTDFFEGGLPKIMGALNGGAPLPAALQPAAAAPAAPAFAPAAMTPAFGGAKP